MKNMTTRIVIIGNSGSGKSHLAESLSRIYSHPIIHLDRLFWMPGGFNEKRQKDEVRNEIEQKRKENSWIAEGVFGELAELFLPRAQTLIYLDVDWAVCHAGLTARGSESSRQLETVKAGENFRNLVLWAEQYWTRTNSCSHTNHLRLLDDFTGRKFRFTTRTEVCAFIEQQKQKPNPDARHFAR
jgi:adenylate kinase family enzyme